MVNQSEKQINHKDITYKLMINSTDNRHYLYVVSVLSSFPSHHKAQYKQHWKRKHHRVRRKETCSWFNIRCFRRMLFVVLLRIKKKSRTESKKKCVWKGLKRRSTPKARQQTKRKPLKRPLTFPGHCPTVHLFILTRSVHAVWSIARSFIEQLLANGCFTFFLVYLQHRWKGV